jgi:arabinofuranosyltransferase
METQGLKAPNRHLPPLSVLAGLAMLMAWVIINGWVSDDAYITFRFLENFYAGNGLRWNVYERVQAYTHPLWMLLHIPLYGVWDNIFLVTITISILCTIGAIVLVLRTFERPASVTLLCFLLPLGLSKIFVDFSTSGLENALSHLLFASFGYLLIRQRKHPYFWFYCSLNVALAMLNRLDVVILYLPPLLYITLPHLRRLPWKQVMLGALPLISWFAFSLFYYGFLFPNTKYAKLNTGIASFEYMKQGVLYFFELFSSDAFSYMILCVTLARTIDTSKDVIVAWCRKKAAPTEHGPHTHLFLCIGLGTLAYMVYVTIVGGDFMSGRFLVLPYFVTVWLIYATIPHLERKRAVICLVFLIGLKGLSLSMASDSLERCMGGIKNPYPEWGKSFCV